MARQNNNKGSKESQLEAIISWDERLKATSYAMDLLEAEIATLDTESAEFIEYMGLLERSRDSWAKAYSILIVRRAQLGIVNNKFYEEK